MGAAPPLQSGPTFVSAPLSSARSPAAGPPAAYWLIPLAVAVLRAIPFLATRLVPPPAGSVYPPAGYNPVDWFAYVGFIRQAAETGDWLLLNPHTTLPQDGRYFLPLFSLLGWVCRLTGLDPFVALELSRVPLVFAFFAVFWRFAGDFLPEQRTRLLAAGLLAFAGGLECLVYALLGGGSEEWQQWFFKAISDEYGWNGLAAFYNPLWVAGLTLALGALRPVFQPPAGRGWTRMMRVAVAAVATFWVHPYSGLGVLAIGGGVTLLRAGSRASRVNALWLAGGLAGAAAVVAAFSAWQHQDPVFHATARRFFGPHGISVLWYPLTLGALGGLAARGAWRGWRKRATGTRELLVWVAVAVLLHSSPWTSGYHFVFLLPVPLCLLATPALERVLAVFGVEEAPPGRQFAAALVVAMAFQSAPALTWRSTRRALGLPFPAAAVQALETLGREPAGRVYASPMLGSLLPAYSSRHRVVVGHWFLTPDYVARRDHYNALMAGQVSPEAFLDELGRVAVSHVLLPPRARPEVLEALGTVARRVEAFGEYRLFWLGERPKAEG